MPGMRFTTAADAGSRLVTRHTDVIDTAVAMGAVRPMLDRWQQARCGQL